MIFSSIALYYGDTYIVSSNVKSAGDLAQIHVTIEMFTAYIETEMF